MQRVIVTVKRKDENKVRDLEVPAEVEVGQLTEMIAKALRWETDPAGQPIQYKIMAEPPGRAAGPGLACPGESGGSRCVGWRVVGVPSSRRHCFCVAGAAASGDGL